MTSLRLRVHQVLEQTRRNDPAAVVVNGVLVALILANVLAVILETAPEIHSPNARAFALFDAVSVAIFTVEFLARLWSAPEAARPGEGIAAARLRYLRSPGAIIDVLAILPWYLQFLIAVDLRALRALRLVRILKLARYSPALSLLSDVLVRERGALFACVFILSLLVIVAATGAYLVESRAQPDKFGSIPAAMWWAVSALTTVGYGDVTPVTPLGKVFGSLVTILGMGMAALPAGILATGFAEQLTQRRRDYEERFLRAIADGVIDPEEARELEILRLEYGISRERARQIRHRAEELRAAIRGVCPHCGKPVAHAPAPPGRHGGP